MQPLTQNNTNIQIVWTHVKHINDKHMCKNNVGINKKVKMQNLHALPHVLNSNLSQEFKNTKPAIMPTLELM